MKTSVAWTLPCLCAVAAFGLMAARSPSGDIPVTPGTGGGNANVTYPLTGPADSAAAPDFSFAASPSTGLFSPGANLCAAAVNGAEVMRWTSAGAQVASGKQLQCASGSAASPCLSFSAAPDRGFFSDGTNNAIGLAVLGSQIGYIGSGGLSLASGKTVLLGNGTPGAPSYSFSGYPASGFLYDNSNNLLSAALQGNVVLALGASSGAQVVGPLSSTGPASFPSASTSGNVVVGSALNVAGPSSLAALNAGATQTTTLASSGTANLASASIAGNLNVSGSSTLSGLNAASTQLGALTVSGATSVASLAASGNVTLASNLGVSGPTTLGNLTAAATQATTLSTSGTASLAAANVAGSAVVGGNLTVSGNTQVARIQNANGTIAAPAYGFVGAPGSGVFVDNANNLLGLANQGNQVLLLSGNENDTGASATLTGPFFSDSSAPILRFSGAQSLMAYPDALWVRTPDGTTASQLKAKNVYTTGADATSGDALSGWNGNVAAGALRSFRFYNSSRITDLGDGIIQLFNNASNSFSKLYFGPYTTSFPMLKVNGGGLLVRTGDDTAMGTLGAGATSVTTLSTSGLATLANSSVTGSETVGTRILVGNGNAAGPALGFSNSTGTGWYFDGASLAASVAGTQVAYFTPPSYNQGLFINGGAGAGVLFKTLGTNQLYLRNGGDTAYTSLNAGRFMTIATPTSATATGFSGQSASQGVYFPTSSTMGLSNGGIIVSQYDSAGTTSSLVPLVTPITAATYTTTRSDSLTTLTNTGSTVALNVTLASTPDVGTTIRAVKVAAQTFTITAGGSAKFAGPSGGTNYTVLTLSNVGTAVNLQYVGSAVWQVMSMVNTVAIN